MSNDERAEKRIWVTPTQQQWVNTNKQGDEHQSDVLGRLIDAYENGAESPAEPPESQTVDVDALADALAERLEGRTLHPETLADTLEQRLDTDTMNPDDVRAAVEHGVESALEGAR
jgi:hypothetical protein